MAETLEAFRRKVNTEHREATTRSRSLQNAYKRDTSPRFLTVLITEPALLGPCCHYCLSSRYSESRVRALRLSVFLFRGGKDVQLEPPRIHEKILAARARPCRCGKRAFFFSSIRRDCRTSNARQRFLPRLQARAD